MNKDKAELYKNILKIINDQNLDLNSVINSDLDHKHIYLELLMTPDLLPYLLNTKPDRDHFYLIYKFTSKFNIKDDRIFKICKENFKHKEYRSIINKILNFYDQTKVKFDVNSKDFKYVKKYITEEDITYFPSEYTKIGYINLRSLKINTECKGITGLFLNNIFKNIYYDHKDEEVRIQNFINDPERDLESFIERNFYIEHIYNIDYLIKHVYDNISYELLSKLIGHEETNVRYLGYSFFNDHDNTLLNNLLFDKSKIIRNKFVNLYKRINLSLEYILNKKINQETLFNYLTENNITKQQYLDLNKKVDLLEIYFGSTNCKDDKDLKICLLHKQNKIDDLVDILLIETDLKYILRIEKYLNELFINADDYDYTKLIEKTFRQHPDISIRKSGGLSVVCKCLLKNKHNRKSNLQIIIKNVENFMEDIHIFNIFIEIYREYKIIEDERAFSIIMDNIGKDDFMKKNMCLKIFEILFKRGFELLNCKIEDDDALFVYLVMAEKNKKKVDIKYEGNNLLVKSKLREMQLI